MDFQILWHLTVRRLIFSRPTQTHGGGDQSAPRWLFERRMNAGLTDDWSFPEREDSDGLPVWKWSILGNECSNSFDDGTGVKSLDIWTIFIGEKSEFLNLFKLKAHILLSKPVQEPRSFYWCQTILSQMLLAINILLFSLNSWAFRYKNNYHQELS